MNPAQQPCIYAAKRTALGRFNGQFRETSAPKLGAAAITAVLRTSKLPDAAIEEVLMGQVLSAGCGQAPARQAALGAGVSTAVPCSTINKVCGSGLKAITLLCDQIQSGQIKGGIAGGMENMSRAPYLNMSQRLGSRLGHQQVLDHMYLDGLQDAYNDQLMGQIADQCAAQHGISRAAMDEFASASLERAQTAIRRGYFIDEICPLPPPATPILSQDEIPLALNVEKIPHLRPAFGTTGQITAANAASIADGAAALLIGDASYSQYQRPLARICGYQQHAESPDRFPLAPIGAISKLMQKLGWQPEQIDLFEINEAFASVCLHTMRALALPHTKVNVRGGACALGHPIGATGARLVVSLVHALRQQSLCRGIASLCIGGGEAMAIAIEIDANCY